MYTTRLVPSDFRIAWFDEQPDNELYDLTPSRRNNEIPSKIGNQPPLAFYSPVRPGPMRLNGRANKIKAIIGEESDELSLEMGRRLDLLKDQSTWGYNWMIPLGMNQTAKGFHDDKSAENGLATNAEEPSHVDNQNVNDNTGDASDILIENAYSRPITDNQGHRVISGASIDESSTYEVGDIAIHDHNDEEEEEEEEDDDDGEEGEFEDHDLDAEMSYHGMLDNHDDLSSDSEDGNYMQGRYLPDNLHSSFHVGTNREEDQIRDIVGGGDVDEDEDQQYFMAHEDYQDDHSIIEPPSKALLQPPSSRIISDSLPREMSRSTRVFPQSSNITTASTLQSTNANQLTGQTSIFDNSSDSDMIIE